MREKLTTSQHTGNTTSCQLESYFDIKRLEDPCGQDIFRGTQSVRANCFEMLLVKAGKGTLKIDSQVYELQQPFICCIAPGQLRLLVGQCALQGYYMAFTPALLHLSGVATRVVSWLDHCGLYRSTMVLEPDVEMQGEAEIIARKMEKEFAGHSLLKQEILSGLLHLLIMHFSRKMAPLVTNGMLGKDGELVKRFMQMIKEQVASKKMVIDYADALCVTPNSLNRAVKKVTGYTASYQIQQQIILEAKRQLLYTNVSMKEIAYRLGFDDMAHFSKFFKNNNSGKSFTCYKRDLLQAS